MKKIKVPSNILSSARALQASYEKINAPRTQNVRNPFPMPTLIRCVLPTHSAEKAGEFQAALTLAKPIAVRGNARLNKLSRQLNNAINNLKTEAGLTVTDITETLTAKGFLVNKATVRTTLNTMSGIGSFPQKATVGKRGRGESLYFVQG